MLTPSIQPRPQDPRYNNSCVLRNIDLDNPTSLRKIMVVLEDSPNHPYRTLNLDLAAEFNLQSTDIEPLNRINRAIIANGEKYPLLKRVIARFVEKRNGTDQEVLQAVRELEELTTESVLCSPSGRLTEYQEAVEKFDQLVFDSIPVAGANFEDNFMEEVKKEVNGRRLRRTSTKE